MQGARSERGDPAINALPTLEGTGYHRFCKSLLLFEMFPVEFPDFSAILNLEHVG